MAERTLAEAPEALDATESAKLLLAHLRSGPEGLSSREAARRLLQHGPNALTRRGGRRWPREIARQFTHPLALLLWAAALLAWLAGIAAVAVAIVVVIVINAIFAFIQEAEAERAVEALAAFLPERAKVLRDGACRDPGPRARARGRAGDRGGRSDLCRRQAAVRVDRGGHVDAHGRVGPGPAIRRSARPQRPAPAGPRPHPERHRLHQGDARAVVFATGMHSELGRIAALSERVTAEESPLEHQVRRVAWLIALIAVGPRRRLHPDRHAGGRSPLHRRGRVRGRAARRKRPGGSASGDHPGARRRACGGSSAKGPWSSASAPSRRSAPPT